MRKHILIVEADPCKALTIRALIAFKLRVETHDVRLNNEKELADYSEKVAPNEVIFHNSKSAMMLVDRLTRRNTNRRNSIISVAVLEQEQLYTLQTAQIDGQDHRICKAA